MKTSVSEISVGLEYNCHSEIADEYSDPDDFILNFKAEIQGSSLDDDKLGITVTLGQLDFYLIRVGEAINAQVNLAGVFDCYQETMDAGCAVFDSSFSEFQPAVQKLFPDAFPHEDILLLHRLTIHPLARGQRLGLAVLHRAIRDWSSGCSLVVMKPYPLQFECEAKEKPSWNELQLGNFPAVKATAFKQLSKYYERLGFQRLGRSEFSALATYQPAPSAKDLNLPDTFKIPVELLTAEGQSNGNK
jgi:GNAT superfamily N-acetyltransferase